MEIKEELKEDQARAQIANQRYRRPKLKGYYGF
jgi:hypothetical protein